MKNFQDIGKGQTINLLLQLSCWGTLFFLSCWYYKERACIGDAAYISNELISKEHAVIIHNRFTLLLVYFMPLLLIKGGASIKAIALAYGINQFVISGLAAFLTIRTTKKVSNGWYILVAQVLYVHELFYYLVLEPVVYMIGVMYFVIADYYLKNNKHNPLYLLSFVVMGLTMVSSPNNIILFVTLLAFLFLIHPTKIQSQGVKILLMFVIMFACIKWMMPLNSYETGKLEIFKSNLSKYEHLDQAAISFYARSVYMSWVYKGLWIMILALLAFYRKWLLMVGSVLILIAVHYLICLYLYNWEATAYMELYYQLVGIPIAVLGCYVLLESKWMDQVYFIFFAMFLFGIKHIYDKGYIYTRAIQVREQIIDDMAAKNMDKGMVKSGSPHLQGMVTEWAAAYESFLLSTMKGKARTFYVVYDKPADSCNTCFVSSIAKFDDQAAFINKKYFDLQHQSYRWVYPHELESL